MCMKWNPLWTKELSVKFENEVELGEFLNVCDMVYVVCKRHVDIC
jgi:hypothetical protein